MNTKTQTVDPRDNPTTRQLIAKSPYWSFFGVEPVTNAFGLVRSPLGWSHHGAYRYYRLFRDLGPEFNQVAKMGMINLNIHEITKSILAFTYPDERTRMFAEILAFHPDVPTGAVTLSDDTLYGEWNFDRHTVRGSEQGLVDSGLWTVQRHGTSTTYAFSSFGLSQLHTDSHFGWQCEEQGIDPAEAFPFTPVKEDIAAQVAGLMSFIDDMEYRANHALAA